MERDEDIENTPINTKTFSHEYLDQLLQLSPEKNVDAQSHEPSEGDEVIPLETPNTYNPCERVAKQSAFNLYTNLPSPSDRLRFSDRNEQQRNPNHDKQRNNSLETPLQLHSQPKDEPLDLSFETDIHIQTGGLEGTVTNQDFNLEFSAISASRQSDFKNEFNETTSHINIGQSPLEFLTLEYSQTTEAEFPKTLSSPRNIQHVDTTQIPNSVQRLYNAVKKGYSDFAFVYSLCSQMCTDRVPMNCFVHLKMGLVLSIVSLEDNPNRSPIPVVAIGPEFDMAHLLMERIGNVAERFIGPHSNFKTSTNKSGQYTWFEADPIIMASGGIYYVGDWSTLKPAHIHKLLKTVECGEVMIERTAVTCPLRTAIWTHWHSYKKNMKDQQIFNKFLEIFGIPIIIEDENHEALVDFILEQASVDRPEFVPDVLSIGDDDMRKFLSVVSKRRMDLTNEAAELLRKYFVAARIEQPDSLTQQSFTTLKLFAESFAKLSLRHEVIAIDAISAIYMAENFIHHVFGSGSCPPPTFKSHTTISSVDEHICEFRKWVFQYIAQFGDP